MVGVVGGPRPFFGTRQLADRRERRRGQRPPGGLPWATISCGVAFPCGCCRCRPRSPLPGMKRSDGLFDVAGRNSSDCPCCSQGMNKGRDTGCRVAL
jgi:hypothetical protein